MQKEKVRVYQLARELNVDTKILLDLCKQSGFDVKNQLSNLEPEQRDALEEMVKRGSQAAAKPAVPVKPVTPVVAPDQRAVPNLGRARREHEAARTQPSAAPAQSPVAPAAEAPSVEQVAAQAAETPAAATPPVPSAPVVPTIKERVPMLPSAPRGGVPTLSSGPARRQPFRKRLHDRRHSNQLRRHLPSPRRRHRGCRPFPRPRPRRRRPCHPGARARHPAAAMAVRALPVTSRAGRACPVCRRCHGRSHSRRSSRSSR